jgi:polysaccharide chain length determinant protein (PEP-CTERM system associated)
VLPGKMYSSQEIVRAIRRRWWVIAVPLVLGLAVGVAAYQEMPVSYKSETLIAVVPQRVPESYVRSTVTARIEDRIPAISDQILSRTRLERIIKEFDLFTEEQAKQPLEDIVQQVRSNVHVDPANRESFRVSFVSADPKTAQKVTERLASLVIEENMRDREKYADSTNQLIQSQLEEAKRRLVEHEKRLETYRKTYAGQLPSQLPGNLQAIQSAQLQLGQVGASINNARERRMLLDRAIADAQSPDLSIPSVAGGSSDGSDLPAAVQLETARRRLAAFKQHYTAEHPDVRAVERAIAELQVKADQEAKLPPKEKPVSPSEIVRQKKLKDLQADKEILDRQITAMQADEATLRRTISDYQGKVDVVPSRETDLMSLMRDYDTLQETYRGLLAKQEESKLAANLERRQIGEQLRIVDPASLPSRPSNQKQRVGALAGGSLGGLILGLMLVGFLEYRDSSFKSEEDVTRVLALPVLALIPVMDVKRSTDASKKARGMVVLSTALVTIGGAAALVLWRLQS